MSSSSSSSQKKKGKKDTSPADERKDKVDALMDAVYRNDVNSVRSLLRAGVNPAARDSLALQVAGPMVASRLSSCSFGTDARM